MRFKDLITEEGKRLKLHNHPEWEENLGLNPNNVNAHKHVIIDKDVFDYLMDNVDINPKRTKSYNIPVAELISKENGKYGENK